MTKQEKAVLIALSNNPAGLLQVDFREATKREVSQHTVHLQLEALSQAGMITGTEEQSEDGRIKGTVTRYTITGEGKAALEPKAETQAETQGETQA